MKTLNRIMNAIAILAIGGFVWLACMADQYKQAKFPQHAPVAITEEDRLGKEALIVQALFIEPYEQGAE